MDTGEQFLKQFAGLTQDSLLDCDLALWQIALTLSTFVSSCSFSGEA